MSDRRSESDVVKLRRLARESASDRNETVSTVHLLAAVWSCGGPAQALLDERKLDAASLLRAARTFDETIEQPIATALVAARDHARRAAVPSRGAYHSSRSGGPRPAAAAAPSGIHVLLALLSNRRFAAYRALAQCGVDIGRMRSAATRIVLGVVAPPRKPQSRSVASARAASQPASDRPPSSEVKPTHRSSSKPKSGRPRRRPSTQGSAVEVPLIPPLRKVQNTAPGIGPSGSRRQVKTAPRIKAKVRKEPAGKKDQISALELDAERFPTLAAIGNNLTLAAARDQLDPVIGRDPEIEQALDVLAKRHGNSPVLCGPPGVGKTSVARGIAKRLLDSDGEVRLLIDLPVAQLIALAGVRGAPAERLAAIFDETRKAAGRVVLFIDEIHELLDGSDDLVGELRAALASGDVPLVGATCIDDFRRAIEADAALMRRFSLVEIDEPSEADAFLLLRSVARGLGAHHGVDYSDEALAVAVSWSIRYLPGRALPDKAVSALDLAGARLNRRAGGREVEPAHVAEVISEVADVPMERLMQTDHDRMLNLKALLSERIVGHDEACARIADVLRRNAAGLRGRRPIGTFLLLGPTGVGKTETAKAVAEVLFHSPDAMTRLDMSEYAEAHAIARMIGAPPGYIGHEAGGLLTESVRRRPYQVVLLDEIEKAHRDVLQAFLQVFDEGRLTDGRGRTVDFTNSVLVLTSNIGSAQLREALTKRRVGFAGASDSRRDDANMRDVAINAARARLAPELYNRIDEVVFFRHLERADVRAIALRLLSHLEASLAHRGVRLSVEDAAIDALMESGGYDAELGARPMRRAIARLIEAPLADMILRGELDDGTVALVTGEDGEVVVDAVAGESAASRRAS